MPLKPYLRSGYVQRGATIEALARACAIAPRALAETVTRFNEAARRGEDPEFGRGSTAHKRKQGDPMHGPKPCVAPIEQGPFYAVKVLPGCFGTFAGLKTNAHAQVLGLDDAPITGLYAVGADMASVMRGFLFAPETPSASAPQGGVVALGRPAGDPSGGINLGPALTFGYIAARHAAGELRQFEAASDSTADTAARSASR